MREAMGIHPLATLAVTGLLAALASGCVVSDVQLQAQAIGATGRLLGAITTAGASGEDVVVVLFQRGDDQAFSLRRRVFADAAGRVAFVVPAGEYYLAAFQDSNGDSRYQKGEPGHFYGAPTAVRVPAAGQVEVSIDLTAQHAPFVADAAFVDRSWAFDVNLGRVTTLADGRFDPQNGVLGLWLPVDFLNGPAQGGLFMLGPYDARRIPVIFVHGMGGGPRDFSALIASLDPERYQPWVLYYPSGLRLDMISDYFVTAVFELQRRYGVRRFAVVAHSMGGLLTRSFVSKYTARYPEAAKALRMVVTVNSPMMGMASAALGVTHSPIVVPVWQDVATDSEFVRNLAASGWPAQVPYHVVFSYSGSDSGDGTVPLESQIPLGLQAEATRLHGFKDSHAGTLRAPAFFALLRNLLGGIAPAASPPQTAAQ